MARSEEQPSGETRFLMLETLREYARERLEESGEAEVIRGRHAEFFAGDSLDAERFWPPGETPERFRRINAEADNLRVALHWAHETLSPLELTLAVLYQRSDKVFPAEGRARLERAFANPSPQRPQLRARALAAVGGLCTIQGDLVSAHRYMEECLELYRELGDELGESVALGNLEVIAAVRGDEQEGLRLVGESEALARRMGEPTMISRSLNRRAMRALEAGRHGEARELLHESLDVLVRGKVGFYWESDVHMLLAWVELVEDDYGQAVRKAEDALVPLSALGEDWVDKWDVVDVLSAVLAAAGELETGVRLQAAVIQHRERRGEETPRLFGRVRRQTHGHLERALASQEFADAVAEGRRLSLPEALDAALASARRVAQDT